MKLLNLISVVSETVMCFILSRNKDSHDVNAVVCQIIVNKHQTVDSLILIYHTLSGGHWLLFPTGSSHNSPHC